MALPNPFYRRTSRTRSCWSYTFELTYEHPTPEQCQPLKHSYDRLGEQVLNRLNEISPPPSTHDLPRNNSQFTPVVPTEIKTPTPLTPSSTSTSSTTPPKPRRDLYALLETHHASDPLLSQFWTEIHTVPPWVDWAAIARGQDVFYRYGGACLTGLAYQSLLGGMGGARVVETLARTGGFSARAARGRLFETTQHILQCTRSLAGVQPGGEGFASTVRVRLLHAAVRKRILTLERARPGYYDVEAWGVPINDLDSLATIVTFSASLVWVSLPRQGIFLRRQEIEDYVALWRYVGYVIGCPDEHFESPERARRLMESLLLYEVHPSETSRVLANNIIKSLEGQPPNYASAEFLTASARWLNGNELCDALGLMRPGLYYWALMAGQCLFFGFWSYTNRTIPSLDRKKVAMLKDVFYKIIVHSPWGLKGEETQFDFKYIPEYSIITTLGESDEEKRAVDGVESRNLKTLLIGLTVGTLVTAIGTMGLVKAVNMVTNRLLH